MQKLFLILKRSFLAILFFTLLVIGSLYLTGYDYVLKAFYCTYLQGNKTATIDDAQFFDHRIVMATRPQIWEKHPLWNTFDLTDSLKHELERYKTAQFVLIKDGKLLYEKHFREDLTIFNSFSMSKTVTTLLLGFAIEDGYVQSLDQKMIDFIPEYKEDLFAQLVSLGDLSRMASGYGWKEDYFSPINPTTEAYYGNDVTKTVLSIPFIKNSKEKFEYLSGNTQLLGIALSRALGKPLAQYLQEKLWAPLGMERDALWGIDHPKGMEKTFCCIYAQARDYAKIGQFLLNNGQWNQRQLLPESFVQLINQPDLNPEYGYSLWTNYQYEPHFYMLRGHGGQYVIVIPEEQLVIVRLGEQRDESPSQGLHPKDVYVFIEESLRSLRNYN